ncbi:hypothetical protein IMZ48_02980, partial [Candidatus Bathyarchaeota archaeon]|nr:hypothetical protein [Candidatus Bathyarchaeota archaeon]
MGDQESSPSSGTQPAQQSPDQSPTPSMTPSPNPPGGSAARAVTGPFRKLGQETLRALAVPVSAKQPRIILQALGGEDYLPGQPRISLSAVPLSDDQESASELLEYLRECHLTTKLDGLMPFMKYVFVSLRLPMRLFRTRKRQGGLTSYFQVQTPDHGHIYPLHHQAAHAREIIVNENPGLHLVWYYDRIFVKPIPVYFLSAEFWSYLRNADEDVYRAAVGFIRSYYYLVRYELDYDLACKQNLIPRDHDGRRGHMTYAEFCRFIEQFARIENSEVCRRYHYGELRLTRINYATVLRERKLSYFHIYPQWGSYLAHFFAPIILVLGGASVIMNAMQVNLNAQEMLK